MPFSGLLFVCLPFLPKRVLPVDKHILLYVIIVLNWLNDGLYVTLFLIDGHWEYKHLTCQNSSSKSVTNVLDKRLVRNDYL